MLLKPRSIPSPGLSPFVFFYLLSSIQMWKKYFWRVTNTSFLEWYWSQINMVKMIPKCIGVPKKKHKVLLLDFIPRLWSFFSPAFVEYWLYIWLLLHDCILAKVPKTRLHIHKTRQRPIPSIHITKFHKNLDSILFMSEAVTHYTAITLISPHLKTMPKESIGEHHKHLPLKRCKIHFFDLKLASNITFF